MNEVYAVKFYVPYEVDNVESLHKHKDDAIFRIKETIGENCRDYRVDENAEIFGVIDEWDYSYYVEKYEVEE